MTTIMGGMTNLPGTLHTAHDGAWQVAEHGCQVLAWQADVKPVIWFDPEHADESDAVIRGGVPDRATTRIPSTAWPAAPTSR